MGIEHSIVKTIRIKLTKKTYFYYFVEDGNKKSLFRRKLELRVWSAKPILMSGVQFFVELTIEIIAWRKDVWRLENPSTYGTGLA